jgi:transposase-like protein
MYRDRLAEPRESKFGPRRHVGSLLDINQATLRNWIEDRYAEGARAGHGRVGDPDEVRALKKRVAELERANEILKTSAAFFAQAELDRRLSDRGLHRCSWGQVRRRADLRRTL